MHSVEVIFKGYCTLVTRHVSDTQEGLVAGVYPVTPAETGTNWPSPRELQTWLAPSKNGAAGDRTQDLRMEASPASLTTTLSRPTMDLYPLGLVSSRAGSNPSNTLCGRSWFQLNWAHLLGEFFQLSKIVVHKSRLQSD